MKRTELCQSLSHCVVCFGQLPQVPISPTNLTLKYCFIHAFLSVGKFKHVVCLITKFCEDPVAPAPLKVSDSGGGRQPHDEYMYDDCQGLYQN